jgi:hypothetical protein
MDLLADHAIGLFALCSIVGALFADWLDRDRGGLG